MTFYYGLRKSLNLADIASTDKCLENLGLDKRDLSVLVGTSDAGVSSSDYQNCIGLTSSLESQITTLTPIPASKISGLGTKIQTTGTTGIGSLTCSTVNSDRSYVDTNGGIYSASSTSFFSPLVGSNFTGGGQFKAGTAGFPSGLTASSLNYKGSTLSWSNYFVRYRSYFQLTDSGNTTRYLPLYLAPPSALASNITWLDSEYSQFTIVGQAVAQWRDVLNRNAASQTVAAQRPLYVASDIAVKPGIAFDGTNDSLLLDDVSQVLSNGATVIAVFSLSNSLGGGDSSYAILTNFASNSASWSSGGSWGLFTSTLIAQFPGAGVAPVNGTHIVSIRASQTYGLEYRLNGTRGDYKAPNPYTYSSSGTYNIGGRSFFRGTLHALAIYNSVLDDKALKSQEEYFRWRYGFVWNPDEAGTTNYTNILHDEYGGLVEMENGNPLEVD